MWPRVWHHKDNLFYFYFYFLNLFLKGFDCCSNETVSFHRTTDGHLSELEYLIYRFEKPINTSNTAIKERTGRLLCWITLSKPIEKYYYRGLLIRKTWGRRCDSLIFLNRKLYYYIHYCHHYCESPNGL